MLQRLSVIMIVISLGTAACEGSDSDALRYTVRFDDAKNHYIDVELRLSIDNSKTTELMMPVWTPGSYLIREHARHIERVEAFNEQDDPLSVAKEGKNRWIIATGDATDLRVVYRVYCREMSVRTNWVDDEMALLNGAPTFLTLANGMKNKHRVRLELPDHWKRSVTSMKRVSDGEPHHYVAKDFDELVDSPIVCGNPTIYPFNVGDREHLLVNVGEAGIWDGTTASRDVAKIVAQQQAFWGVVPYDRYIFFNLITESGGGLEHDNSTVLMTSRWSFRNRKSYVRWLSLVSHEFFHTWNVRRLRPQPLVEYDYESENYTKSLWIAEGITSYYESLCMMRAGVCTQKEFLTLLSKEIEGLQNSPGRMTQSLRDSSHDTWIKFYRPDENSRNARISYYTKGAVVAFLLDAHLRHLTTDRKSLDDVMRILYERHAGKRGFTPDDFRTIAAEVAGTDLSDWFRHAIDSSEELQYDGALNWWGLQFGKPAAADEKKATEQEDEQVQVWLGTTTQNKQGRLIVTRVRRDSPAFRAGINANDEIVALGEFRVLPSEWEARLKQYKPGDDEVILVARRDKLRRIPVTFAEKPAEKRWQLAVSDQASDEQQRRLHRWLGIKDTSDAE